VITHVRVNAHIVWESVLYVVQAAYQEDPHEAPVLLEKRGMVPLGDDGSPESVLAAVLGAVQREGLEDDAEGFAIAYSAGDVSHAVSAERPTETRRS
jgi:hypothetical protein